MSLTPPPPPPPPRHSLLRRENNLFFPPCLLFSRVHETIHITFALLADRSVCLSVCPSVYLKHIATLRQRAIFASLTLPKCLVGLFHHCSSDCLARTRLCLLFLAAYLFSVVILQNCWQFVSGICPSTLDWSLVSDNNYVLRRFLSYCTQMTQYHIQLYTRTEV